MMLGFWEFPCRGLKKEAKYKKKREIVLNLECWTKKTRYTSRQEEVIDPGEWEIAM